jgi:hypothetical protein
MQFILFPLYIFKSLLCYELYVSLRESDYFCSEGLIFYIVNENKTSLLSPET